MLTFFRHEGRCPASKHELPPAVLRHLAGQVGVAADAWVAYDWRDRSIKYHRVRIRAALGFRETSVQDVNALVGWLLTTVLPQERLSARPWPPTSGG